MIKTGRCPKCGGTNIAGPHRIFGEQHVRVDLPGILTATLEAVTCANCGYTELYSDSLGLENIRKAGRFLSTSQSASRTRCPYCETELRSGASFCPECGNTV
ncbi:zinc-ribbon domain-containing protein [Candidatus Thorarchaeota archaeon]|nr:MAG: zinc-ribbon domain-containing protein [Candidatus Thorarchaeota archaeon]